MRRSSRRARSSSPQSRWGKATQVRGRPEAKRGAGRKAAPRSGGGGSRAGCPRPPGGGKSGDRALSSWRRQGLARGRRSSSPSLSSFPLLTPPLPFGRAPRHAEGSRKREGRGLWSLTCSSREGRALLTPPGPAV